MKVLNFLVKFLLVGLIALVLLKPDLSQFAGKAMMERAITYPIAIFIVPLWWRFKGKQFEFHYPYLADIFIVLPFVIDLAGNALNFYDTIVIFDDIAHFINWVFLVSGFGILLSFYNLSRLNVTVLVLGIGATTHTLWEIIEYTVMKLGTSRLFLTYEDTMGDFILSFLGSLVAAVLSGAIFYRKKNI